MYYGPTIILSTGVKIEGMTKERMAILLNLPLAAMNAIGTTIAIFIIDGKGRRFIMLRTLPGQIISLLLVSVCMYFSLYTTDPWQTGGEFAAIGCLIIYIGFFSIGFSSTPWSVNTEIYPIHLVSTGTAIATATNWFSNFIVSATFLSILATDIGKVIAFILLACFALGAFIFVFFKVPETNNRPIQVNVDNILKGKIR